MMVERAARHAGRGSNMLDAGRVIALILEQGEGRVQDARAHSCRVVLAAAGGVSWCNLILRIHPGSLAI